MLPGPTVIRSCPECDQKIGESTLQSGNTFGSTFWSDGKVEAPMLPSNPDIVKCPTCKHAFWLQEAEIAGEDDSFGFSESIPYEAFVEPSEVDYLQFIEKHSLTPDEERYVRITSWQKANDVCRRHPDTREFAFSQDQNRNLEALRGALSDSDPDQRLMKAEIARELGLYDEALNLLSNKTWDHPLDEYAQKIRQQAENRVSEVFALDEP